MKKLLTAFLAMAFLVGVIGCGGGDVKKDVKKDAKAAVADTKKDSKDVTPPAPGADTKKDDKGTGK